MSMSSIKQRNGKIINGTKKQKITTEDVLEAIRKHKTESPSELADKLKCNRRTIYRKLEQIPRTQIDGIFKELSEFELKPHEMQWSVFIMLPEMVEYRNLLMRAEVSPRYRKALLHGIFNICKYLKVRPRSITIDRLDELADVVLNVKSKKIRISGLFNEHKTRNVIRSWFIYHGTSGTVLTAKGIGGQQGEGYGKRSLDRITIKQRENFMIALRDILTEEGYSNDIPVWESLVYWLFYTGTRITASCEILIENIRWSGNPSDIQTIGKIQVTDKGRHRKGRVKWIKLIAGALKNKIIANLESRSHSQQGKLFNGIYPNRARKIFRMAYERANILVHQPAHIWRHTASQELLDATDWNYEVVASILGWKDTKTLKECYGAMGESVRIRALKRAMGIPIEEQSKFFRFLVSDMPFPLD
ncbi:MAG: tyrosine-type recombinase/integrase [Candidatus Bathyarchaeota archaeon]|nr:tyrosine-type recombinase/integrase [Candidatus Bathyarchaeota archaeon]